VVVVMHLLLEELVVQAAVVLDKMEMLEPKQLLEPLIQAVEVAVVGKVHLQILVAVMAAPAS